MILAPGYFLQVLKNFLEMKSKKRKPADEVGLWQDIFQLAFPSSHFYLLILIPALHLSDLVEMLHRNWIVWVLWQDVEIIPKAKRSKFLVTEESDEDLGEDGLGLWMTLRRKRMICSIQFVPFVIMVENFYGKLLLEILVLSHKYHRDYTAPNFRVCLICKYG